MKKRKKILYLGVDVGGTKIRAALVRRSGEIVGRRRCETPRGGPPSSVLKAIVRVSEEVLAAEGARAGDVAAVGVALPGIVAPAEGRVLIAPNLGFRDTDVAGPLRKRFGIPVAIGNDVNLGTLGEKWLGAARFARNAVGIFVGTGIGGGIVSEGRLLRGAREAAGEIGHTVMSMGGPVCSCGARGCLEALAGRSAIERDIRAAVAAGRRTVLTSLVGPGLAVIKSGALRAALDRKDAVAVEVLTRASEVLGLACLNVRHLLDPDVIVLGGGVVEACGDFMLGIVEKTVAADPLPGALPGGWVVRSLLGDDAVILGAVAAARREAEREWPVAPGDRAAVCPEVSAVAAGRAKVDGRTRRGDLVIRADGSVKRVRDEETGRPSRAIGPDEIERACRGGPGVVVIGAGVGRPARVLPEALSLLRARGIAFTVLDSPAAAALYNRVRIRKALLLRVTG